MPKRVCSFHEDNKLKTWVFNEDGSPFEYWESDVDQYGRISGEKTQ